MDIVIESVKKLESLLEHSGCCDSGIQLDVDPDIVNCQYEKGACLTASFGGKCGVFATFEPIRACTKISFMFGAPLDTAPVRGAACAIVNVATGFFCLARTLRPCAESSHIECGKELMSELKGKSVYMQGIIYSLDSLQDIRTVSDPSSAEVILIAGQGIIAPGTGDLIEKYAGSKRIICLGPSTAGTARLNELEHWCPHGSA